MFTERTKKINENKNFLLCFLILFIISNTSAPDLKFSIFVQQHLDDHKYTRNTRN